MKNRSKAEISESDELESDRETLQTNKVNNSRAKDGDDSSSSSSDSEESSKPAKPVYETPKRQPSESPKKKVAINPLERFLSENEDLTKINLETVIDEDDDICLLEVPKILDPSNFMEKMINFDKRTKIKINKTKYIVEPEIEDIKPINLLTKKLQIIHPISVLKLREYNKQKHKSEALKIETTPPSLPENLKVRHPLFGSDYEEKIILNEEIQKKLDNAIEKATKKKKKHKDHQTQDLETSNLDNSQKKKKHKKNKIKPEITPEESNEQVDVEESIFALLESHLSEKNKSRNNSQSEIGSSKLTNSNKSIKLNNTAENDVYNETPKKHKTSFTENKHDSGKKKKQKKIKQEILSQDENESSLESDKEKKYTKLNNSFTEMKASTSEDFDDHSKRKKKKQNSIKVEKSLDLDDLDGLHETRKRKNSIKRDLSQFENLEDEDNRIENKTKKNNIANSTVIPGLQLPIFEFDVSGIGSREEPTMQNEEQKPKVKKEKRKIKQEILSAAESSDELSPKKRKKSYVTEDEEAPNTSPTKKLKKVKEEKKDETTNSLIMDLLKKVKSEMDTGITLKKKKKSDR